MDRKNLEWIKKKTVEKVVILQELSTDCPECGSKLWQIFLWSTTLNQLEDIKAIECECGFRIEFGEEDEG